jgi:DNA-binding FadR family transcriptional regulator
MVNESKSERLANEILDSVESERLAIGSLLGTKSVLCKKYSVAAGTMNEALRILQVRGIIDFKPGPNGGVFVASGARRSRWAESLVGGQEAPEQMATYISIQDALEELVVVTAARNCTPDDAQRLRTSLDTLRAAEHPPEVMTAIWQVDRAIARATGNRILDEVYSSVLDGLERSLSSDGIEEIAASEVKSMHENLALAVMANDVAAAQVAARLHSPKW